MLAGPSTDGEVPGAFVVAVVNAKLQRRLETRADAADENRISHQIVRSGLLDLVRHGCSPSDDLRCRLVHDSAESEYSRPEAP